MTRTDAPNLLPNVNGVWEYRGVLLSEDEFHGGWQTYAVIIVEKPHQGATRLHAASQKALLRKIDRHLDSGGRISG